MTEYLDKNEAVDESHLTDWFIHSLAKCNNEKLDKPRWTKEHIEELINDFIVIPKDAPASDVAPIVRCKDCKYAYINSFSQLEGVAVCRLLANKSDGAAYQTQQDDFCSHGERKKNDNG